MKINGVGQLGGQIESVSTPEVLALSQPGRATVEETERLAHIFCLRVRCIRHYHWSSSDIAALSLVETLLKFVHGVARTALLLHMSPILMP